jgi:toxin ParE1/3/4
VTGRIIWHDAVKSDLRELSKHIAVQSPRSARRFLDAVDQAMTKLARMPGLGVPCEFQNPDAIDLRYWVIRAFPNHLIIYRPLADGIEVIRVFHGARDWQSLFDR